MFQIQKDTCRRYGFVEYGAPILEPLSLYQAKSSEEIVGEQIYRFTDRGDREVAIRPEMTPTLARMVAARWKELPSPLRYFSIANFMRYERPGKGRLREFFQLNVDLIGSSSPAADAEILGLAADLLLQYGAKNSDFTIRFSDRRFLQSYLGKVPAEKMREVGRLLDKREKIGDEAFRVSLMELLGDAGLVKRVESYLKLELKDLPALVESGDLDKSAVEHLLSVERLARFTPASASLAFDTGIVRGFDYYTGLIFEINDNHPENRRALFGGGRYDRLMGLFGGEEIPAVGFGMGDVTLDDFLEAHSLKPEQLAHPEGFFLSLFHDTLLEPTLQLAGELRQNGIDLEVSFDAGGKFKKQLQSAERKKKRYVIIMGEDEWKSGKIKLKDLVTGDQQEYPAKNLSSVLRDLSPGKE